ncbi:ATP/GTP-binding protein [Catenulispora subtropica]|uniref:AAA family ATPase n=1 Tax=Catenulispora subtropica TaxID=450798 RepID=A0ABN2RD85_9ACTN
MKRYVLTGTPGAGKTTVIDELRRLGHPTVGEAATEVIARGQAAGEAAPWEGPGFVDRVLAMQQEREVAARGGGVWFFDRSPVCTLALSRYLGRRPSRALTAEIERIRRAGTYERTVFFLANLGFVEPTAARRISFEDALVFERVHREVYGELGYELCDIPVAAPGERAAAILEQVAAGR